ncbi:MAG: DUF1735 domain-containing protein [Ferruginibacter sp.]
MGDQGSLLVKLVGGGTTAAPGILKNAIDFKPIPITVVGADLQRAVPNNASLNTVMHVTVKDDTAAVHAADPSFKILPAAWYTIGAGTPKTGGSGGTFNITIPAGEFAAPILITIPDATVLDPSTQYGLGFTITSVDGGGKISSINTTVSKLALKTLMTVFILLNRVMCKGILLRERRRLLLPGGLNGDLTGGPDVILFTTGAYSVGTPTAGNTGSLPWAFGANNFVAGIDGTNLTVDPATNLVTASSSGYGSNSNATFANWPEKPIRITRQQNFYPELEVEPDCKY